MANDTSQYWDSITKEDLEFSVGTKQSNWEVKEPMLPPEDQRGSTVYMDSNADYSDSMYFQPAHQRGSHYGGY
jgi:hypothetical protein